MLVKERKMCLEEVIIEKLENINKRNISRDVRDTNNEIILICKNSIKEVNNLFK